MTTNALSRLETGEKTVKRAQYEAFEFDLEAPGILRVTNGSHEDPEEHTYRVNVEDGVPTACECKSFEYRDGACKHMVAVAIRNPVLDAADGEPAVATDGGQVETGRQTDHFGQTIVEYDEPAYGSGEACECTRCGQRSRVALVAGTADPSNEKWEEHYECDCGATGKFRVHGPASCEWIGQMEYPSGVY